MVKLCLQCLTLQHVFSQAVAFCLFPSLSLPPPSWLCLAFRPVSPDSTILMDMDIWRLRRFVSTDNSCFGKKHYIRNKEHIIGLELGVTYDDEARSQWAVRRNCLESQQIHIHYKVHCIIYLRDVLVLEFWLLISWSLMNHLSIHHTSFQQWTLHHDALSPSMEDVSQQWYSRYESISLGSIHLSNDALCLLYFFWFL